MEKQETKNVLISVLGVAILIVAVVGISYAAFTFSQNGNSDNTVTTGTISMSYTESDTNVISIDNAMPTSDNAGKELTDKFDFSVSSTISGAATVNYEVRARNVELTDEEKTGESPKVALDPSDVKLYLEKENSSNYEEVLAPKLFTIDSTTSLTNPVVDTNTMLLYTGSFTNDSDTSNTYTENFRLRMWLKNDAVISTSAKTFKIKVDVFASVNKISGQD